MKPRAHVAICVPSGDEWKALSAKSLIDLISYSNSNGIACGVINWRGAMVTAARNGLVELALSKKGVDAILWVDSDIAMPADALVRLFDHGRDIAGCFYNKRVPPHDTVGRLMDIGADIAKGGLHEAEFLPGGFVLVKTAVYRKIGFPWFFETYRWPGSAIESFCQRLRDEASVPVPDEALASMPGALRTWIEENHAADVARNASPMVSEDISFCKKARRYGYKMWCDVDLTARIYHLGTLPVQCMLPQPENRE